MDAEDGHTPDPDRRDRSTARDAHRAVRKEHTRAKAGVAKLRVPRHSPCRGQPGSRYRRWCHRAVFFGARESLGKGSAPGGGSATAERVDHFHLVPFAESMGGVLAARDDGAVDLDRDAAVGQAFPAEQIGDGGGRCEGARGTVEQDVHGAIVARDESRGTAPYV